MTTVGEESDPEAVGLSRGGWSRGSGRRPSASTAAASTPRCSSACGARARWCSTARSATRAATGPTTTRTLPKVPVTTETPFCVYSTSKAVTALRRPPAGRARGAGDRRPGRRPHPRVRAPRQGRDHDRPRARPPGRGRLAAEGGARPRPARRPRAPGGADLRRQAGLGARAAARLPRGLGRVHPRRGRRARHRASRSASVLAERDPRPARLPLEQLRGRADGRRPGRAQLRHRARGCCRRSPTSSPARSAPRSTR